MKILSIGGFSGFGNSNTCLLRNNYLKEIGEVDEIDTTSRPINLYYRICNKLFQLGFPVKLPDLANANKRIIAAVTSNTSYDVVWIDKGVLIDKSTFQTIKNYQPQAKIIGYSPDWMAARHNQSKQFLQSLPFYDCYATTKSYSVDYLYEHGAKHVLFVDNAYQKGFHRPYNLERDEAEYYISEVSFIGSWEKERSDSIVALAESGIAINIWGSGPWAEICNSHPNMHYKGGDLNDERYCKVISASKISLCFLRKMNLDLQTTRSVEIPACGSLMLAERTVEHQNMFKEGVEADFFSSNEELIAKCKFYLSNETRRAEVAASGHRRCIDGDYSYGGRIQQILKFVFNEC